MWKSCIKYVWKILNFPDPVLPMNSSFLSIIFPLGRRHGIHNLVFTYRSQKSLMLCLLKFILVCACLSLFDQKYLVKAANFFQSFVQSILILFTYLILESQKSHSVALHSRNHFRLDPVSQSAMKPVAFFHRYALRSLFLLQCA